LERGLVVARGTGYVTIGLLLATLTVTPFSRALRHATAYRRPFGLATAVASLLHLAAVVALDDSVLRLPLVLDPHSRTGFLSFLVLMVLGLTSFPGVVRALHVRLWKPLHRMVYGATALGLLHLAQSAFASRHLTLLLVVATVLLLAVRPLSVAIGRRRGNVASAPR
jgi:sulfoxide reductase heme-binding subunit YedZ